MARPPVKPNEAQRAFNAKLPGARKDGLRRAHQIAKQRQFTYDRQPARCVCCLAERDPRSDPVCDHCARRHREGVR
jgi:hypothetical protein